MQIIDKHLVSQVINPRNNNSHKGDYGRVMLIGGFKNYHGAIILASMAAVYAGSGLVTTVTDKANISTLNNTLAEVMAISYEENFIKLMTSQNVVVIGPGLGLSNISLEILKMVFNSINPNQTLVIDGSALTLIAQYNLTLPKTKLTVLTPHEMEWQRISGIPIKEQSIHNNQQVVDSLNAIVIVKKHHSELYVPYKNPRKILVGTPAQATGGMGDTLAGLIGSFLGQFEKNQDTISAALYLHSFIADCLGEKQYVVLPSQISTQLPYYMKKFSKL